MNAIPEATVLTSEIKHPRFGLPRSYHGEARPVNPPALKETEIETTSPTVWRRWLAREMRRLRKEAGLDQRDVAARLRCTVTKVSYIESGERAFRERDLYEILLPLYGVPEDQWSDYLIACKRSRQKGWWDAYDDDILPDWYKYYLGLEQGASTLRGFVMQVIPGILQSGSYARVILAASLGLAPEDAAARLDVRLHRQELLTRDPEPLHIHYVLDEAVVRRVVGDVDVMREQLEHLAEMGERPNVTLQVLTFQQGYYFDGAGEPVLLGFPWNDSSNVVFVESRNGGDFLEKPHEVEDFGKAFDHVQRLALPPPESLTMIRALIEGEPHDPIQ